jgi:hypothetical protein
LAFHEGLVSLQYEEGKHLEVRAYELRMVSTSLIIFEASKKMLAELSQELGSVLKVELVKFVVLEINEVKQREDRHKLDQIWEDRGTGSISSVLDASQHRRDECFLKTDRLPSLWIRFAQVEESLSPKIALYDRVVFRDHVKDQGRDFLNVRTSFFLRNILQELRNKHKAGRPHPSSVFLGKENPK